MVAVLLKNAGFNELSRFNKFKRFKQNPELLKPLKLYTILNRHTVHLTKGD
jgi:hypothetical protein